MNKEGAVAGMIAGMMFTSLYILYFKFYAPEANIPENWIWGISPEGIGTLGMLINFGVSLSLSRFYPPPPEEIQTMVEDIRHPF